MLGHNFYNHVALPERSQQKQKENYMEVNTQSPIWHWEVVLKTVWSGFKPEHSAVWAPAGCTEECKLLSVSFPLVVFLDSSRTSFLLYTMSSARMTSWRAHSGACICQAIRSYSREASHIHSRNELRACLSVAGTGMQLSAKGGVQNIASSS